MEEEEEEEEEGAELKQANDRRQNAKDWATAKAGKRLTSPSVSTMSPRVTALAPSPAAATSEFPDDGEAEANRIADVAVVVAAFAFAAAFLIGGSSVAHAAVDDDDDDEEAADVEAVAPARMREAAWRSITGGEGERESCGNFGYRNCREN